MIIKRNFEKEREVAKMLREKRIQKEKESGPTTLSDEEDLPILTDE